MDRRTQDSMQLAQLWLELSSVQDKIDNHILPAAHHLGIVQEDDELCTALEACSEKIRDHFARLRLCAERRQP